MSKTRTPKPKPIKTHGQKISHILKALPDAFSQPNLTIGDLKKALSGRSYGILLLLLALPNLIPLPTPGLSAVLGAPLVLVTFQLMLGRKTPWLPNFLAKRKLNQRQFKAMCDRATRYMEMLEHVVRPRFTFVVRPPADRVIAFVCLLLSLLIMLPIPFGNALPAFAICLFALGIIQMDGLLVIVGALVSGLSLALIFAFKEGIDAITDLL